MADGSAMRHVARLGMVSKPPRGRMSKPPAVPLMLGVLPPSIGLVSASTRRGAVRPHVRLWRLLGPAGRVPRLPQSCGDVDACASGVSSTLPYSTVPWAESTSLWKQV